ncbi:hypothetical protein D3C80_1255480 [compost metagenome]
MLGIGDQLLLQVGQRQAQRQATVLGGTTQRLGAGLAVTDQAAAVDTVIQPPAENRGPIAAPQREAGLAQGALGTARVELDQHRLGRAGFAAHLVDDLLRVFAQRGQRRALHCLWVAGQAQHQRVEGLGGGSGTGFGALPGDRLAYLIKARDIFSLGGGRYQGQATGCQNIEKTHGGFLSSRARSSLLAAYTHATTSTTLGPFSTIYRPARRPEDGRCPATLIKSRAFTDH